MGTERPNAVKADNCCGEIFLEVGIFSSSLMVHRSWHKTNTKVNNYQLSTMNYQFTGQTYNQLL